MAKVSLVDLIALIEAWTAAAATARATTSSAKNFDSSEKFHSKLIKMNLIKKMQKENRWSRRRK